MSKFRPITKIDSVVIHCSATPNGRWVSNKDIDSWHAARGFKRNPDLIGHHEPSLKAIGYHHVLYTSGGMANGRRYCETGAHALDKRFPRGSSHYYRWNNTSIGICLVGTDQFSLAQWRMLRTFIVAIRQDFRGDDLKILGHNEVNPSKTCPGFDVQAWLAGGMQPMEGHVLQKDAL